MEHRTSLRHASCKVYNFKRKPLISNFGEKLIILYYPLSNDLCQNFVFQKESRKKTRSKCWGEDRESIRKWWRERKDSNSNHDWVNSNPFLLFLRDKREIKVLAVSFLFPHKTRSYTRTGYTENWKCSWKQSHYFAFSTDTYFKIIDIIELEWIFSTDRLSL